MPEEVKSEGKDSKGQDVQVDLQKALDVNLETMNSLLKAGSKKSEIEEHLKDPETRKKVKDMMSKYDKDEDEEEAEEEDEEEEAPKMKHSKIKKSLDEVVEENEEVIDAVPVLKSFANVIDQMVESVEMMKSKLDSICDAVESHGEIQKAFAEMVKTESAMLKSVHTAVEAYGKKPQPKKGVVSGSEVIQKSFNNEDGNEDVIHPALVKSALLEGFKEGKVAQNSIAKWEIGRYNFDLLSDSEKLFVKSFVSKGAK